MTVFHAIKCWPEFWDAIDRGEKTFEVRLDDRGYQKGDVLHIQKFDPKSGYVYDSAFGGHVAGAEPLTKVREITFVLSGGKWGIEPGYVVLGFINP